MFTNYEIKTGVYDMALGEMASVLFLVIMMIFAVIVIVGVPFMVWLHYKNQKKERDLPQSDYNEHTHHDKWSS